MDRHRREEPEPRRRRRAEDRRRFRHRRAIVELLQAPGGHLRHHRDRRASARRSDHGRGRARRADADREAAGDRSRAIRARAARRSTTPSSTPWSATPSASAANGSPRKEKVRTGALGDVTLVTSRAFMNRLVAIDNYKRTDDPTTISPMVISGTHALDIVHVVPGEEDAGRVLRALDRQGAGPALPGHRRHRRHDHVRRTAASITSTSPGRCR